MDCEKWRQEINLDHLVPNFDYKEKAQIFEYYPQYYHKTDKVCFAFSSVPSPFPVSPPRC